MNLSKEALALLAALFNNQNVNLPTSTARLQVEIQDWVRDELAGK